MGNQRDKMEIYPFQYINQGIPKARYGYNLGNLLEIEVQISAALNSEHLKGVQTSKAGIFNKFLSYFYVQPLI